MADVTEIFARVKADFEKSVRDEAKAQESLAKASSDVARYRATLEVLGEYISPTAKAEPRESGVAREGSKAKAIVDLAISFIEGAGPTFGPKLLEVVELGSIDLGNNPKQTFASAMSRDPRVVLDKAKGWKLVSSSEEIEAEANSEGETPASLYHSNEGGQHGTALI